MVGREAAQSIGASLTSPFVDTERRPDKCLPTGALPSWLPLPPTFSEVKQENKGTEVNMHVLYRIILIPP
jgi:hypothetical protein